MSELDKIMEWDKAQLVEVIITTNRRRGMGVEDDPIRVVVEIFLKDGTKIAEVNRSDIRQFIQ